MSIFIKGVDLPKNRGLYIAIDNGDVYVKPLGELHWKQLEEKAVELQPHGRLIDADALDHQIYNDIPLIVFGNIARKMEMRNIVYHAPTVIEAEGAE